MFGTATKEVLATAKPFVSAFFRIFNYSLYLTKYIYVYIHLQINYDVSSYSSTSCYALKQFGHYLDLGQTDCAQYAAKRIQCKQCARLRRLGRFISLPKESNMNLLWANTIASLRGAMHSYLLKRSAFLEKFLAANEKSYWTLMSSQFLFSLQCI